MKRPSRHETWLTVAHVIAGLGTCKRRRTGCVLLDGHGFVLSTGYNGPGPGQPHCIDVPCAGVDFAQGEGLDKCEAIHAEQNALITCKEVREVKMIYCTTEPCVHCTKMLLRTSALELYFLTEYPNNSGGELWRRMGRKWHHYISPPLSALLTITCGTMPDGQSLEAWLRFNDRGKPWSKP